MTIIQKKPWKENHTTEFSFLLKPSQHGVGVFAVHDIAKGTYLRLFGDEEQLEERSQVRKIEDIPEVFRSFCMYRADRTLIVPKDFGCMPVGWYLNHAKEANAFHRDFQWYAARDIQAGEEILIDYNTLEEPENAKEVYYKK